MQDQTNMGLLMENIRFFAWLIGSICSAAMFLLGLYLKLYVRDVLHEHADMIRDIVAANYVKREVYEADMRALRTRVGEF